MKILLFIGLLVVIALVLQRLGRKPPRRSASQPSNLMDISQAKAVLGLENRDPSQAEVIEAHRRLMQRVHPDKGGSAELAAQLNEAKRVLLQTLAGR